MKAVFKFKFGAGRYCTLHGIFIADTNEVVLLLSECSNGGEVDFGEVAGKHSQVCGPVESREIELITDDPKVVKIFLDLDMEVGFNPFEHVFLKGEDDYENFTEYLNQEKRII